MEIKCYVNRPKRFFQKNIIEIVTLKEADAIFTVAKRRQAHSAVTLRHAFKKAGFSRKILEASPGIEPGCKDLQSSA